MLRTPSNGEIHLGYLLRHVSNQVAHSFSQKLAAHDVTAAEWFVIRELNEMSPLNPSVLAAKVGMGRGAISKLADRLVNKKMLIRSTSGSDGRHQALALTRQGKALIPILSALADQNDTEYFGHLNHSQRVIIEMTMREIAQKKNLKIAASGKTIG